MYLFLILLLIIAFAILKFAWPLILGLIVVFLVLSVLAILQRRKEDKKKNENIIEATYTEREVEDK